MAVRLMRGGAYTSDITNLIRQIRANGTNANCFAINVTHPAAAQGGVNLIMNLAYQANGSLPAPNASLYIAGFSNPNGVFRFNGINPFPCIALAGNNINIDGSYQSLGFPLPGPLPVITDANLAQAVNAVRNYNGGNLGNNNVAAGLTRLIIAISEAVRFGNVSQGVNSVLGNANQYVPPAAQIRAWGGHSLGS